MTFVDKRRLFQTSILGSVLLASAPAFAQDADTGISESTDAELIELAEDDAFGEEDNIVVTGSRIARDAFTTTSPLQVLTADTIDASGFVNLGDALSQTSVVQGIQIDNQSSASQVSEVGPGGQSIGLRGLGAPRTLILINGRRFAPAGIEGAPSTPDISLIPTSMIERNEILLDGASSVYGSDAIAGVVNLILRDEFEGIEFSGQANLPTNSGGEQFTANFIAGTQGDNGSFVISGEYYKEQELLGNERDWMCGVGTTDQWPDYVDQTFCHSFEIDTQGRRRISTGNPTDTVYQQFYFTPPFNILLPRPGTTNPAVVTNYPGLTGPYEVPNFERASLGGNFNGLYGGNVELNQDQQLLPDVERLTLFTTAKVDTDNMIPGSEFFSEFSLSNRTTTFTQPTTPFAVTVPVDNPYIYLSGFAPEGATIAAPFTVRPLRPFQGGVESEITQYRTMFGLTGDFNFLGDNFFSDWTYEAFAGYTRSVGYSNRAVLLEENLLRSINTELDANGNVVCSPVPNDADFFFGGDEQLQQCIPLNPFATSLLGVQNPSFEDNPNTLADESQLLLDYLRGNRSSTTFVDQKIAGAFVSGDLFELPGGTVKAVFGAEWREDGIDTKSDDVTSRGLGTGFFRDLPTTGTVNQFEVYGEALVPVISDKPFIENLEFEVAGRYVDNEFYGSNETYAAKLRYQPTDWLTLRGTYGTSFKAPDLRRLFLQGQSSFRDYFDPCQVPRLAQEDTDGDGVLDTYNPGPDTDGDGRPDLDGRSDQVITNCQSIGLDPFSFGIGINFGSIEVFSAGNQGLEPETSDSYTLGFVVDQPFFDSFDMQFGLTYWNIEINDAIFEPSEAFLIGSCIRAADFPNNAFCTRQLRGTNGALAEVDVTPFNIGAENASGVDWNSAIRWEPTLFGQDFEITAQTQITWTEEDSTTITIGGETTFVDDAGTIGSSEWRGNSQQRIRWNDLDLFWNVRWIGEAEQTEEFGEGNIPRACSLVDGVDDGTLSDIGREANCANIDDVFYHDISIGYSQDTWSLRAGLRNAFDKAPPQISAETFGVAQDDRNVPLGAGYDRRGRTLFISATKNF